MKKYVVQKIIDDAMDKSKYFMIITDIATGRGINGVDYTTFRISRPSYSQSEEKANVDIYKVNYENDYVAIHTRLRGDHTASAINYIDYESIKQIVVYDGQNTNYSLRGIR